MDWWSSVNYITTKKLLLLTFNKMNRHFTSEARLLSQWMEFIYTITWWILIRVIQVRTSIYRSSIILMVHSWYLGIPSSLRLSGVLPSNDEHHKAKWENVNADLWSSVKYIATKKLLLLNFNKMNRHFTTEARRLSQWMEFS